MEWADGSWARECGMRGPPPLGRVRGRGLPCKKSPRTRSGGIDASLVVPTPLRTRFGTVGADGGILLSRRRLAKTGAERALDGSHAAAYGSRTGHYRRY